MALFDDLFKAETAKGLAIGAGLLALAPLAVASLAGASRPLARAAVKGGIILYDKGRETAAEFSEVMEDLVAEARAELEQQQEAAARDDQREESEAEPGLKTRPEEPYVPRGDGGGT